MSDLVRDRQKDILDQIAYHESCISYLQWFRGLDLNECDNHVPHIQFFKEHHQKQTYLYALHCKPPHDFINFDSDENVGVEIVCGEVPYIAINENDINLTINERLFIRFLDLNKIKYSIIQTDLQIKSDDVCCYGCEHFIEQIRNQHRNVFVPDTYSTNSDYCDTERSTDFDSYEMCYHEHTTINFACILITEENFS